jgi:hypothetical protein
MTELVIDENNFDEHFFDVRKHRPQKGQVLAKFTAIAEFIEGQGKKDVIDLLKKGKVLPAIQVMKKLHGSVEPDCYRICREMCEDLLMMSEQDVENKPYEYKTEWLFYTKRENVPMDDLRWETIPLLNLESPTEDFKSVIEISPHPSK